jgi:hypothetical protein
MNPVQGLLSPPALTGTGISDSMAFTIHEITRACPDIELRLTAVPFGGSE